MPPELRDAAGRETAAAPAPQIHRETRLDFQGLGVMVKSSSPEIHNWLEFDFSGFLKAPASVLLRIEVNLGPAQSPGIPALVESMHGPEYVCYDRYPMRYVDYYGRALVLFDYSTETALMYSQDAAYVYEKLYLLILSRVGEALDRRGLHRVHAVAVSYHEEASLFLMPSRGGKSTLALSLLNRSGCLLLSEDTPLIDHHATVHPFALKMGIGSAQVPPDAAPGMIREFRRERWGTKVLLHLDYFRDRIETQPRKASYVFVGKWIHCNQPSITRMSRMKVLAFLLRDCVFGLGLPQIVEYFLTSDKKDLLRKTRLTLRRLAACIVLAARSEPYLALLGLDSERNAQEIIDFWEKKAGRTAD